MIFFLPIEIVNKIFTYVSSPTANILKTSIFNKKEHGFLYLQHKWKDNDDEYIHMYKYFFTNCNLLYEYRYIAYNKFSDFVIQKRKKRHILVD